MPNMSWSFLLDRATLVASSLIALLTLKYVKAYRTRSKPDAIPTVGPDGILSSYYTIWRYLFHGCELIEEGCRKYPGRAFKIPTLDGWQVVVNGPKLIDDIRRAPEKELSNLEAIEDLLKASYTISPALHNNPYHIEVIRTLLTRNIVPRFDDLRDEIVAAFNDNIPVKDHAVEAVHNIVVRTSNRMLVGLPLCRDPDYCDLNINFTVSVAISSALISLFPEALHPIVGRIFTKREHFFGRAMKHLGPIIEERLKMQQEYGKEWPDKPNDYISWLIDLMEYAAEDWQKGLVEDLVLRVLAVNFAAIHTTSMSFTHALYHLAANPHLAGPLREEVATTVGTKGWSKAAMVQTRLMDSFLKESQRHVGAFPLQSVTVLTARRSRDGSCHQEGFQALRRFSHHQK
ncbi:cytochrome p450 [Moniliophthora roreri MCA 2997]|uniref:Cytochrome p450 n=1 Tax=Moniliophthora roreri (strain MCA 2997) TaxID=1381753 RepID=V2WPL3_MONRO|nr:cytochrome p450 [Moniliophthora roreri MCA 2997]